LEAGVDPDGGGALRVVALDAATGEVRADHQYELLPATACPPGASSCPRRMASLLLAPGRLVIAEYLDDERYPPKITTRLAAFG
jgi:hypothetical protein